MGNGQCLTHCAVVSVARYPLPVAPFSLSPDHRQLAFEFIALIIRDEEYVDPGGDMFAGAVHQIPGSRNVGAADLQVRKLPYEMSRDRKDLDDAVGCEMIEGFKKAVVLVLTPGIGIDPDLAQTSHRDGKRVWGGDDRSSIRDRVGRLRGHRAGQILGHDMAPHIAVKHLEVDDALRYGRNMK